MSCGDSRLSVYESSYAADFLIFCAFFTNRFSSTAPNERLLIKLKIAFSFDVAKRRPYVRNNQRGKSTIKFHLAQCIKAVVASPAFGL